MRTLGSAFVEYIRVPSLSAFARDERIVGSAKTLISWYYAILPFAAFLYATNSASTRQNFDPLWPIAWSQWFDFEYVTVLNIIRFSFFIVALLAVLLYRYRAVRILAFIVIWQAHALESSFGSLNHQWYLWLYTSLVFVFLPNVWSSGGVPDDRRKGLLLCVWWAQAIVALTYTMAGLNKLIGAIQQSAAGEISGFSVDSFAYQVADWVPKLQSEAPLADFIVNNPEISWLPYAALHFLQFFSLWVMIRMNLQKLWAVLIVLFHFGTYLAMGISFHPQIILVIVLFFNSPFVKPYSSVRAFVLDLPIVGQIAQLVWRSRAQEQLKTS